MLHLQVNWDILTEGYSHHTPQPRTRQVNMGHSEAFLMFLRQYSIDLNLTPSQFGHNTHRDPALLLDDDKFALHAGR